MFTFATHRIRATRAPGRVAASAVAALLGLAGLAGCGGGTDEGAALPPRDQSAPAGYTLVARFAQLTDTHVTDALSPARLAGFDPLITPAWRPQSPYSAQLLDGFVRAVNRMHAGGRRIDFLLHTGDAVDNVQSNERAWFLAVMDGAPLQPLSGPDDRGDAERLPADLDPYAAFAPQGVYQQGRHGDAPTIPWFVAFGNHDVYACGTFPIFADETGHRVAPLPLDWRPGFVLPVVLDPLSSITYGGVTPAHPGPPPVFNRPQPIEPNPARAFGDKPEYAALLATSVTAPSGHGLAGLAPGVTWYSVTPVAGVRLIVLDTTTPPDVIEGGIYSEGALSRVQLDLLASELAAAEAAEEIAIVATHHPTDSFAPDSPVSGAEMRAVLAASPAVAVHVAGHTHRNRVVQRTGYVEIETAATISPPLEARMVEVWRETATGAVAIAYDVFDDQSEDYPPLGDDPLRALRAQGRHLALTDKRPGQVRYAGATSAADEVDPAGSDADRRGFISSRALRAPATRP
jgi:3',5'-cyclic AMP phosphodiesterase CpdA